MCGTEISKLKKFCPDCAKKRLREKQTIYRRSKGIQERHCKLCGEIIPRNNVFCAKHKNRFRKRGIDRTIKMPDYMKGWRKGAFLSGILESNRFNPSADTRNYRWVKSEAERL